jgi:protein kinase X
MVLCVHKPSSQYFALKMLSSHEVGTGRLKQVVHVKCEMDILQVMKTLSKYCQISELQEIRHPFLIPLLQTSKDSSNPLLLFPYINGGKLYSHLRKARKFSSSTTLFFSAEIVSALSYLHSLNIVHWDLKPKNILLDKEGHVVIIDFGFSKKITERSSTLCGTQKYLAPEIIECTGHDKGVDWWALGILIYEMLVGYPPFFDENPFLISQKILTEKMKWPRNINAAAKDLIEKLLERDRTKRLGSTAEGAEAVKNHR